MLSFLSVNLLLSTLTVSKSFSRVANFAHALGCLQNWQPIVGNIGTIGAVGSTSGINGRSLDDIVMPIVPRTYALLRDTKYTNLYFIPDR